MPFTQKSFSSSNIRKEGFAHRINPSKYQAYLNKFQELQFDLHHAQLILAKIVHEETIRQIEIMILSSKFTPIQIAGLFILGDKELFNQVVLYTAPLQSFNYTAEDICKIAMIQNAPFRDIIELLSDDPGQQVVDAQEVSRRVDTPSPYSQAITEDDVSSDSPVPYSQPLKFFDGSTTSRFLEPGPFSDQLDNFFKP